MGPRPDDREHAALLAGLFYDHELDGARHGYDPFGRLIVHSTVAAAFAVAWPASPHQPEIADPAQAAYRLVQLGDGRVDLVPVTAERAADREQETARATLQAALDRLPSDTRPLPSTQSYSRLLSGRRDDFR
ncbi:hypothetical protein ACSNOI_43930 [Actinomadura kijaniata]|uniref:hypothetical protein n=1 Tax=Actinomadura kijaniata TaxID=46161 RepID=UPI003F1D1287